MTPSQQQIKYVFALALACVSSLAVMPTFALAATEQPTDNASEVEAKSLASNRMSNRLGFYVGINEPAPMILGINVAYNVFDFMRVSAGYGKLSMTTGFESKGNGEWGTREASASTFGFGARAFVPGWSITPTAGVHFGHVSYEGDGLELGGFSESGSHVYGTLGLDWQAKGGFNISLGVARSIKSEVGNMAYVSLGWFFNWLG